MNQNLFLLILSISFSVQAAPRPSNAKNLKVCSSTANPVLGFDISDHQPSEQWPTLKKDGLQFSFIKATEGEKTLNDDFKTQWSEALTAGFVRGAYHFFHPKEDPTLQAEFFLRTVGTFEKGTLPAVLDWEISEGVEPSVQVNRALVWLNVVEKATGRKPMIYTGPSFWNSIGNPQGFADYPLFIANYGVKCPEVPAPWSTWTFWQSAVGTVQGINGKVDEDRCNGTAEQAQAFVDETQ